MDENSFIIFGPYIHSKSLDELEMVEDGFIAVKNGYITGVGDKKDYEKWQSTHAGTLPEITLSKNEFLIPGFVDCHIHASQMPNIGLGMDKELLEWLQCHTFPLEIEYSDTKFAEHVYTKVVKRTIANGTTFACYFATMHTESSIVLAKIAIKFGQRALIGKVSANCNAPDDYVETTTDCIKENTKFIESILTPGCSLVKPIITPRFAICCDMDLMKQLGELAKKYTLNIQTHISENTSEIAEVKKIFKYERYAQVYDEANLLTNRSILAHGVHLEDDELELLKKRGTSIAHCPASNTNLCSGFCDVKRLLDAGITVGLGTDISGGNRVSILSIIRDTLSVSTHLDFVKKHVIVGSGQIKDNPSNLDNTSLTYQQAFYLATLGGAKALSEERSIGNFVCGKAFDALIVNPVVPGGPIDEFNLPEKLRIQQETHSTLLKRNFEKFIYTSDDRNILKVFVLGKQIKG